MGVNESGVRAMTDFERGNLELSFKRSFVALTAAVSVSCFVFSPLWVAAAYGIVFWIGRRAGGAVKRRTGSRLARAASNVVAWDDSRLALVILAPLTLVLFFVYWAAGFSAWLEARGDAALLAEEALTGLSEAFVAASAWGQPGFVAVGLTAGLLAAVSGLTDGFWVGAVQSRTGERFWRTVPLGSGWAEWREARYERRKLYLGEGG